MNNFFSKLLQEDKVKLEALSQVKSSHPDCYHALLNLSEFFYKEDSSVIKISEKFNVDLLQPAIQANLINVNNNEVTIIDDLIRQEILIQYVMDEVLLKAWEQQGQLSAVVKSAAAKPVSMAACTSDSDFDRNRSMSNASKYGARGSPPVKATLVISKS